MSSAYSSDIIICPNNCVTCYIYTVLPIIIIMKFKGISKLVWIVVIIIILAAVYMYTGGV